MSNWVSELDDVIFTRIKRGLEKKFKAKYPDIYVTGVDRTPTKPKFPTVYVYPLGGTEQGQTLGEPTINAVLYSVQIEIAAAKDQAQAKEVAAEVVNIMKGMYFGAVGLPSADNTQDTYRQICRFCRMIGNGEEI